MSRQVFFIFPCGVFLLLAVLNAKVVQGQDCSPCVNSSFYEASSCSPPTTDRVCLRITDCLPNQIEILGPTPTTDRECEKVVSFTFRFDIDYSLYASTATLQKNLTDSLLAKLRKQFKIDTSLISDVSYSPGSVVVTMYGSQTAMVSVSYAIQQLVIPLYDGKYAAAAPLVSSASSSSSSGFTTYEVIGLAAGIGLFVIILVLLIVLLIRSFSRPLGVTTFQITPKRGETHEANEARNSVLLQETSPMDRRSSIVALNMAYETNDYPLNEWDHDQCVTWLRTMNFMFLVPICTRNEWNGRDLFMLHAEMGVLEPFPREEVARLIEEIEKLRSVSWRTVKRFMNPTVSQSHLSSESYIASVSVHKNKMQEQYDAKKPLIQRLSARNNAAPKGKSRDTQHSLISETILEADSPNPDRREGFSSTSSDAPLSPDEQRLVVMRERRQTLEKEFDLRRNSRVQARGGPYRPRSLLLSEDTTPQETDVDDDLREKKGKSGFHGTELWIDNLSKYMPPALKISPDQHLTPEEQVRVLEQRAHFLEQEAELRRVESDHARKKALRKETEALELAQIAENERKMLEEAKKQLSSSWSSSRNEHRGSLKTPSAYSSASSTSTLTHANTTELNLPPPSKSMNKRLLDERISNRYSTASDGAPDFGVYLSNDPDDDSERVFDDDQEFILPSAFKSPRGSLHTKNPSNNHVSGSLLFANCAPNFQGSENNHNQLGLGRFASQKKQAGTVIDFTNISSCSSLSSTNNSDTEDDTQRMLVQERLERREGSDGFRSRPTHAVPPRSSTRGQPIPENAPPAGLPSKNEPGPSSARSDDTSSDAVDITISAEDLEKYKYLDNQLSDKDRASAFFF